MTNKNETLYNNIKYHKTFKEFQVQKGVSLKVTLMVFPKTVVDFQNVFIGTYFIFNA